MRFPEFEGEWEKKKLREIVERVTRKNRNLETTLPLTISAQYGLINQGSFFNKTIASANLSHYYLLYKGEFAYNKSYSGDYPWGAIKRLDLYDKGALSTLYICFKPKDSKNSDFLIHYFESPKWHNEISNIAGEGARNHGLLNIAISDFFNTMHYVSKSTDEQQKIATFLSLIDERIATQNKIIEKLESLIRGIYSATKGESWVMLFLRDVLEERNEQNIHKYPVFSVAVREGVINQIEHLGRSFAAKDTRNYNVVQFGNIVYTKSPTGDFPYGIVKQSFINQPVAVSPLYGVYKPKNYHLGNILHHYFLSSINANNYLYSLIQKGAKNTINITTQRFLDKAILLPTKEIEIKNISLLLDTISKKIHLEKNVLKKLETQKKFILQQMFI